MTYTHQDMLAIWRRSLGLVTTRTDCSIEQFEGLDIDALLSEAIRRWYINLLDTADTALLPVRNIGSTLTPQICAPSCARIEIPQSCRRIAHVTTSQWHLALRPVDADSPDIMRRLRRLSSPYARPSVGHPLAALQGNSLIIAPFTIGDTLTVNAVTEPAEGIYILDQALLSTIPRHISFDEPQ